MTRIYSTTAALAALAGLALTVFGLLRMDWPSALPWDGIRPWLMYLACLAALTGFVTLGCAFTRRPPLVVGAIAIAGLALFAGSLWPLIVALWFFLASYLLGSRLLLAFGNARIAPDAPMSVLLGAGIYGSAAGILAHWPINYPGVYGLGLALPLLLDRARAVALIASLGIKLQQDGSLRRPIWWIEAGVAVLAALYFLIAHFPEVGYDALSMHLFVPTQLARAHEWGFDGSLYAFAVMPMLGDWLFSIGYLLGGETAARIINVGLLVLLAALVRDLATWCGASRATGSFAALLLLATPLTFLVGSVLYVDVLLAACLAATVLSVVRLGTNTEDPAHDIVCAGAFAGIALATKATAMLLLPILVVILLWRWRAWAARKWLPPILAGSLLLLLGALPYADAWRLTGNPVFPFYNAVFHSSLFPPYDFKDMRWQAGITPDFLYAITFQNTRFQEARGGPPGFQWLVLLIPAVLLLLRERNYRALLLGLIGTTVVAIVFTFVASHLRYAYPGAVILISMLAAAIGAGLARGGTLVRWIVGGATVFVVGLNLAFLNEGGVYGTYPYSAVFDQSARNEYIAARAPERAAVQLVNQLNTAHSPVALLSNPFGAGLNADALYAAWFNPTFEQDLLQVRSSQTAFDLLRSKAVTYVILDTTWGDSRPNNETSPRAAARRYMEDVTVELSRFGTISVRTINPNLLFKQQLLQNPDFSTRDGWAFASGADYSTSGHYVVVSEQSPVTQSIPITPGRSYRNEIVARCVAGPAIGRLQINWQAADGKFIKANGVTFPCSADWTEHTMTVKAPEHATLAVVYTAGHTSKPVAYRRNMLFQ